MAPVDLKLRVLLDSKDLSSMPEALRKAHEQVKALNTKAWRDLRDAEDAHQDKLLSQRIALQRSSVALADNQAKQTAAIQDKAAADKAALQRRSVALEEANQAKVSAAQFAAEKQRAALQRNSLAMAEAQQARESNLILSGAKYQADSALRIQRQAERAEASLVLDKFDRRIAVERKAHAQILQDLKGNDLAQEAEVRRHNAVVSRIQMDKKNLPNTPFQQLLGGVKQGVGFQNGVAGMAGMAGIALGASFAVSKLTQGIEAAVEVSNKMNTVERSLKFAAGSARAGAEEFQFLRDESNRLGFSLLDAAGPFAQLTAAAKGTRLEGEGARDVFKGITEASVTMGLSGEQTAGALNAIQQMISKGTVQSEELRGQLGERLPGAFQIAARAMGVTTAQLGKMLENGEVMADEFLPKFSAELHKTFGKDAVDASNEARQSIQKMNNVIMEGASAVGGVAVGAYGLFAKTMLGLKSAIEGGAEAQMRLNVARAESLSPELLEQEKAMTAAKAEGLKLAKEAKAQENARARGPSGDQQKAISDLQKERVDAQKKAAEDAKRSAEQLAADMARVEETAAYKKLKRDADIQNGIRTAAAKERDEAIKADEDRTKQIYEARARLTGAKAAGSPTEELKAKQAAELEAYAGNEAAITDIKRAHALERGRLDKEESDKRIELQNKEREQRLAAVGGFFGGIAALTAQANMHERSNRLRWKTAAIGEAGVNTALAATKSLTAAPYPFNLLLMAGTIAAGAAQINQIKDQKFYAGGYTGSGNPRDVAGIVHKDEYVVDHFDLARAGGPAGVERKLNGGGNGGGVTHTGNVQITIQAAPGTTPAQAQEMGARAAVGYRDELKRWKKMERDSAYMGVTA